MHIATISSKRQITLPKNMMEMLGLEISNKVLLERELDFLKLKPIKNSIVEETSGSLKKFVHPSKLGVPWSKVKKEIGAAIGKHAASEGLK